MLNWLKRIVGRDTQGHAADPVLPEGKAFPIGDQVVIIMPLTLAELKRVSAELGVILERIAQECPRVDIEHFDQHLSVLLPVLSGALEEFLGKLLRISPAYLMANLTPLRALQLIRAILEVNQLPLLLAEIPRLRDLLKRMPVV